MKTIANIKFTSPASGEDITTASLLQGCIKVAPVGTGFDFTTMRTRLRVLDVVEKAKDEIVLEDADFATAVDAIRNTRWTSLERHLLKFAEQFGL